MPNWLAYSWFFLKDNPFLFTVIGAGITGIFSFLSFYIGKNHEKKNKRVDHDKNIFNKLDNVLNAEEAWGIFDNTGRGYLHISMVDQLCELQYFANNLSNEFLSYKIQLKFENVLKSFSSLVHLFTGSPFSQRVPPGRDDNYRIKLANYTSGRIEEVDEIFKEGGRLCDDFKTKYEIFRRQIKKELYI